MSIFEELENLNVSEECFDEILESIEDYIEKKYPEQKEEYKGAHSEPANKKTELLTKARKANIEELVHAEDKEGKKKVLDKRYSTKRGQGEIKTLLKQKGLSESILGVSEECFDDIMGIVEAILSESNKARKEAHKEAIFKVHHPAGQRLYRLKDKNSPEQEQAKKNLRYWSGDDSAVALSLKDVRALEEPGSSEVRHALGRGAGWGSRFPKPSKSRQAINAHRSYKDKVAQLKGDIQRKAKETRAKNKFGRNPLP